MTVVLNVDSIIERLLEVRRSPPAKYVELQEDEIRGLCLKARHIFLSQPMPMELEAPLNICGDIHGQYYDLLRFFEFGGFTPESNYLFLGDYVDRGKQSLETMCLLLSYKIKYPENFFLLRGNHECERINKSYGFYDECKQRYTINLFNTFIDCFNCLPVAAIGDKIFCCHGGLSPSLTSMNDIRRIARPTDVPNQGLLCDLLWSDPDKDTKLWGENNNRGCSFTFGKKVVRDFLRRHNFDLICRAHQVVQDGYQFFAEQKLVTLFSAPDYCNSFGNADYETINSVSQVKKYDAAFHNLPIASQKLIKNISSMGFDQDRVCRIVNKLGNDDKKIVEHLIPLCELLDLGFDETQISDALIRFGNNKDKALDYLIS